MKLENLQKLSGIQFLEQLKDLLIPGSLKTMFMFLENEKKVGLQPKGSFAYDHQLLQKIEQQGIRITLRL